MEPKVQRHVAMVEEFMRGWGYAPTASDAEEFLIEQHGLTADQAEAAVIAWESANARPEEGRQS
jgi:hypothetical protein